MLSYEKNFAPRADGRYVCTLAAKMARVRDTKPLLELPEELDAEKLEAWKREVRDKLRELLALPEPTPQPEPVLLSSVQREGYRVEKWEFYPDDYTAVPFLALIPDEASPENPVPAVMCFLGSNHNKEFIAGEPQIDHPNCLVTRYPERNRMGKYFAQNGMAAFVFDNPAIGETSVMGDPAFGETQYYSRVQLCAGYLQFGMNYLTVTVSQKLRFMEQFLCKQGYVDQKRIAVSGHSLGTEVGIMLSVLRDDISAMVFNDCVTDGARRFAGITEEPENQMSQDIGNWHTVPGMLKYFDLRELCAAFAPNPLALTEGAGNYSLEIIRRAYAAAGVEDKLTVSYYPAYQEPATRNKLGPMPWYGMTEQDYFDHNYLVAPDHSFRKEPALAFLKSCFFMKE